MPPSATACTPALLGGLTVLRCPETDQNTLPVEEAAHRRAILLGVLGKLDRAVSAALQVRKLGWS
jgi:hypothetical protein